MIAILVTSLLPLYILIALGYIAGRYMDVNLHSLATVAIYIISPVVVCGALMKLDLNPAYFLLPVIIYGVCVTITFIAYKSAGAVLKDRRANLIGLTSGVGNTGYFGLPLVLALLGPEAAGIYMLMNLAVLMNELTYGYYVGARGHFTIRDSIKKLSRLPALPAAFLGLALNAGGVTAPDIFDTYWNYFVGAWVIIGMMLIGVALTKMETLRPNPVLLCWLFGFKFVVWPLLAFALIVADRTIFGLYDDSVHMMMMLIGLAPLAANTVAYAGNLKLPAGEAAMAVLLSTFFALLYIPLIMSLLF